MWVELSLLMPVVSDSEKMDKVAAMSVVFMLKLSGNQLLGLRLESLRCS